MSTQRTLLVCGASKKRGGGGSFRAFLFLVRLVYSGLQLLVGIGLVSAEFRMILEELALLLK